VTWHRMSFSEPLVWSGIRGRSSTISSSVLLACNRASSLSRVTKPVRRRNIRSKRARRTNPAFRVGIPAIRLEGVVVAPDQLTLLLLGEAVLRGEGVEFMDKPFCVDPA